MLLLMLFAGYSFFRVCEESLEKILFLAFAYVRHSCFIRLIAGCFSFIFQFLKRVFSYDLPRIFLTSPIGTTHSASRTCGFTTFSASRTCGFTILSSSRTRALVPEANWFYIIPFLWVLSSLLMLLLCEICTLFGYPQFPDILLPFMLTTSGSTLL